MDLFTEGLVQKLTLFLVAGLLGIVCHFAKKAARGELNMTLWEYLVKNSPKNTTLTVIGFAGAAATIFATGAADNASPLMLIGIAFTTGWTADSWLNKAENATIPPI